MSSAVCTSRAVLLSWNEEDSRHSPLSDLEVLPKQAMKNKIELETDYLNSEVTPRRAHEDTQKMRDLLIQD